MTENKSIFSYQDVIESFGEEKVAQRYDNIIEQLNGFIKRKKYTDKVSICPGVVNQLVIDYFTDIFRLKEFHHIDLAKQSAYNVRFSR